jgi:hypothetical protein
MYISQHDEKDDAYTTVAFRPHELRLLTFALQVAWEQTDWTEEDGSWLETALELLRATAQTLTFEDEADPEVVRRRRWPRTLAGATGRDADLAVAAVSGH